MNHVIHLITRQKTEILCENPDFDPYAHEFISYVREMTGMACVKASVQSDSEGWLSIDGTFDPVNGPWIEEYIFDTQVDALSGLNCVAFSAQTVPYKYVRVRYHTKDPNAPLGINFNMGGVLFPIS